MVANRTGQAPHAAPFGRGGGARPSTWATLMLVLALRSDPGTAYGRARADGRVKL